MNTNARPPRYTLLSQLRQRDLATVFHGADNSTGLPVFVALLTDLAATDRIVLAALRAELPLLQNADPALITVLDYNLTAPPLYVMVENLNGFNLRQLVDTAGRGLQASEALAYCAEAARCVAAIHSRGAVHGAVHIDDFILRGINMVCISAWVAELFGADLFATTDVYASREPLDKHIYQPPELAAHMGQPPNQAGDIYGLGILLYHMLSGVPPGVAPGSPELAPWLRGGQSPPLDESIADATLRSRLQKFIQVATARDQMRRWPDLKTFINALEQIGPAGMMAMPRIITTVRSVIPPSTPNPSQIDISPGVPDRFSVMQPAPGSAPATPQPTYNSFVIAPPPPGNPTSAPGQAQGPMPRPLDTANLPSQQPLQQPQPLPSFPSPRLETGPLAPQPTPPPAASPPAPTGQYPEVMQYGGAATAQPQPPPDAPVQPAPQPVPQHIPDPSATVSQLPNQPIAQQSAGYGYTPTPGQTPPQVQGPALPPPPQPQGNSQYGYGYPPPQAPQPQPQSVAPVQPQPQTQAQPRAAYLVSLLTGAVYPVSAARTSLGVARSTNFFPDINLAMEPPAQAQFVSQHHLDLFYDRGQWYVQPSTSTRNPTFLNGTHMAPGAIKPIYEGMVLEIPALPLRFSFSIT